MDFSSSTYRAKSFIIERDTSSIAYEVKRTRALWDDGLAVPGTNRRGGWRCPPGTRYGGQITDRFGRNCGWGVSRRLANSITDLGERLENIGERRQVRRENRGVRRQVRRPGVVERAAGRIAEALDDTNTPVSAPRGRRERQGPARRRPNLRNSEQRRMDREINEPGAERTAPEVGTPTRPRPDAPRARRREGAVDVAERKPAKKVPAKKAAAKKVPAKKAAAKKVPAKKAAAKKVPAKKAAAKLRPYEASFQRLGWRKDGDKWVKGNWEIFVNEDNETFEPGALVAKNRKTGEIIEQGRGDGVSTADHMYVFEGILANEDNDFPLSPKPTNKPANSANAVQKLPQGWRQGPGTLAIHENGDIIDEAIITGKWFVIYGRPAMAKDGFDNREDAIAWHKKNVLERKPAKKAGRSRVSVKPRGDSDNAANSERLRQAREDRARDAGQEVDLNRMLDERFAGRYIREEVMPNDLIMIVNNERNFPASRNGQRDKVNEAQRNIDKANNLLDKIELAIVQGRLSDDDFIKREGENISVARIKTFLQGHRDGWKEVRDRNQRALKKEQKPRPKFGEKINLEKALKDDRFNDYLNDVIDNGRLEILNDRDNFGQTESSRFRALTRAEAQIELGEAQIDKIQRLINRGSFRENDYIEVGQGIVTLEGVKELLRENVAAWKEIVKANRPKPPKRGDKKPNPQRISMREAFRDSRFFADYEGAAERIDGIPDGLGVENAEELADRLDAIGERLGGVPQDAIVQIPNVDGDALRDIKVSDLRKNLKATAAAWRRYANRQPNRQPNNDGGIRRLNQVNLDADDAINAVAQIMQDDLGAQEFLRVGAIDELKLANRIQNRDYIQRIREIFNQDNSHGVQLLQAGVQDLQRVMNGRAEEIRRQFGLIESESDDGTKKALAKAAILEMIRFDAQKDQLREMQNFLAELRKKKVRANAPEPNSQFFDRAEFVNFVKISDRDVPDGIARIIAREFEAMDLRIARDVRGAEQVGELDEIDQFLERIERRRLRAVAERNATIAKVIELRGLLAQNRDDAVVANRYWESLNDLIAHNNAARYNTKVAEAYTKRRQQIVEQLGQLGQESTSEILRNENAVKEARDRIGVAIKKNQGILAKYLDGRYGKDKKPWLDMTPEKMKDLKERAKAGEPEAKLELITWAKAMYEHPTFKGSNGKNYQIVMDRGVNIRNDGDINLNGTIYHVDDNGRRTAIGTTERQVHIAPDDPKDWYVKNALLKITSDRHKKAGISTIYNQHAYLWANAAGIPQAKVGTAWDGPYVWARAGFRTNLYSGQVKNMEKQLRLFRDGNMGGLIQNEAEAVRIAALIREFKLWERIPRAERPEQAPVGHIDFIYALDIPDGRRGQVALQKARQKQMKDWFVSNMGLGSGTFDFKQNGITKDPRE